jgi:hypothetical protein
VRNPKIFQFTHLEFRIDNTNMTEIPES